MYTPMCGKERMPPLFPSPAGQQALLSVGNELSGVLRHSTVEDIFWPQQGSLDWRGNITLKVGGTQQEYSV